MVKKQLTLTRFNFNSGTSLFLAGEGSNFTNIEKYCQNFFKLNTTKRRNDNLEKNFSACLGGIRIIKEGWETEAIPETVDKNAKKISFLAKIFRSN